MARSSRGGTGDWHGWEVNVNKPQKATTKDRASAQAVIRISPTAKSKSEPMRLQSKPDGFGVSSAPTKASPATRLPFAVLA
jgi:hypothetical protein